MKTKIKPIQIGFWRSLSEPEYPTPIASIYDNTEIAERLLNLQSYCERENNKEFGFEAYRGISACRICDRGNGNRTYYGVRRDGVRYEWPSDLMHYLLEHNIEPPEELCKVLDFHEIKWKLKRENPKMNLFPFNASGVEVVDIWNIYKPPGIFWNSVYGQVQSPTQIRLVVRAAGDENIIYDEVITVRKEELEDIIYLYKMQLAGAELKERQHARRSHDLKKLIREMFGEEE